MTTIRKVSDGTIDITLPATGTVDTEGLAIRGRFLSARAAWTGTPTGVFKLQVSFDSGVTWSDAPGMSANFTANSQAQPAGSASSAIWSFVDIPGGSWRIRYTGTSVGGAATLRFAWAP